MLVNTPSQYINANPTMGVGKELVLLVAVLVFSVFAIYTIPAPFNKYVLLPILIWVARSKTDYFWLAYLLVVVEQPSGLFFGGSADDELRFPLYSITSGISFGLDELIALVLFIKATRRRAHIKEVAPSFVNWYWLFFALFILLIVVTPLMGAGIDSYKYIKRAFVFLSISYSLLFNFSVKDFESFFKILLPFSLLAVFLQLFSLENNFQIIHFFRSDISSIQGGFDTLDRDIAERPIEMSVIVLINFLSSLHFLQLNSSLQPRLFLLLVNVISFFSIALTATRSWFFAFVLGYLLCLPNFLNKFGLKLLLGFVPLLLCAAFLMLNPIFSNQMNLSIERLSTVQLLIEGDVTAGNTLERIDQRLPKVMKGIEGSSIFLGAAFSSHHMMHEDFHIGFLNMFLNFGILGSVMCILFMMALMRSALLQLSNASLWIVPFVGLIMIISINVGIQVMGFNATQPSGYILQSVVIVFLIKMLSYAQSVRVDENLKIPTLKG